MRDVCAFRHVRHAGAVRIILFAQNEEVRQFVPAACAGGLCVLRSKDRSKRAIRGGGVSVYFLPNDKVAVDVYVNVNFPCRVPETVAAVQQRVKEEIEGATRFRVHSVNVQVVSVLFPAQN